MLEIAAVNAGDLRQKAASLGIRISIDPNTHHAWAQRSAGDELDGRGKAGTFVCTFCGQERKKLSDGGRSCSDEFNKSP